MTASENSASPIRLRRYTLAIAIFWTIAIAIVLTWELQDDRNQASAIAHSEALGAWKRDAALYKWVANMGGIYVPVVEGVVPDETLEHMTERDIATPSGKKLTLIGMPTILKRLHAIAFGATALQGHITSLNPIQPKNKPDAWEQAALESFVTGDPEACSEEVIDGTHYMRLMRPLRAEPSCMRCHVEQSYKVGDVRGGLSVAAPMDTVWSVLSIGTVHRLVGYGGMWILGLFGIATMSRQLRQQIFRRDVAERRLQEANDLLEQRVTERTAELAEANQSLENEIIDRRQAEQWLLESEQRFRGYFEQGVLGMAILTETGEWVEVNSRLYRMLGYHEEELLLKTWAELANADARQTIEREFRNITGGIVHGFVIDSQLIRKDGRVLSVGISAQCLKKADGTFDCILILVQDISHRRPT